MNPEPELPLRTLLVFAKAPRTGFAKTRLAADPALGPEGAAELAQALLADTLATTRELAEEHGVATRLVYTPREERAAFTALTDGVVLVPQADGDLGARLTAAFAHAFAQGARYVVVIGTDAPELAPADLLAAFERLATADVVLGPATDGGYWLAGLRAPRFELFQDVPWSTARVLGTTAARARELGLSLEALRELHDIDEPADVAWLRGWLAEAPASACPAVRAILARRAR